MFWCVRRRAPVCNEKLLTRDGRRRVRSVLRGSCKRAYADTAQHSHRQVVRMICEASSLAISLHHKGYFFSRSTQLSVRSIAFCQPAYTCLALVGAPLRLPLPVRLQFWRSSSRSRQKPVARPAA